MEPDFGHCLPAYNGGVVGPLRPPAGSPPTPPIPPTLPESPLAAFLFDPRTWAQHQFHDCQLGDRRRNRRLCRLAAQVAARPDGSTPDQTEAWADLKAAYRLFDCDEVTPQAILAPHCAHTKADCPPGSLRLIVGDTTELAYTARKRTTGLGPVGNGQGQGFFLHSGLMVDPRTGQAEGLAGQEIFYRPAKGSKRGAKNTRRRDEHRESAVWGRLIDRIGKPPPGVVWRHVCDRAADDYEVFRKALANGCSFVIRAARLNRKVLDGAGKSVTLGELLAGLPVQGERLVEVKATTTQPARTARVALRFAPVGVPEPKVLTPWLRANRRREPLPMSVVELREIEPPAGAEPVRWVLYVPEAVEEVAEAERVIGDYEKRPTIEEFHKCLKTGCRVEGRQYRTGARLERVAALLSVVAVRLLQLRGVAEREPEAAAEGVAPVRWVQMLRAERKWPAGRPMTIREFVRQLAGLGGHLGRKGDGEPGWMTLWRGYEKLHLLLRGAEAELKKSG